MIDIYSEYGGNGVEARGVRPNDNGRQAS